MFSKSCSTREVDQKKITTINVIFFTNSAQVLLERYFLAFYKIDYQASPYFLVEIL